MCCQGSSHWHQRGQSACLDQYVLFYSQLNAVREILKETIEQQQL